MERESGISLALQTRKSRPQRTTGLLGRLREEMQGPEAGKGRRRGPGPRSQLLSSRRKCQAAGSAGARPYDARDVSPVWRPIGSTTTLLPGRETGRGAGSEVAFEFETAAAFKAERPVASGAGQLLHSGSSPSWRKPRDSGGPWEGAVSDRELSGAERNSRACEGHRKPRP